MWVLSPMLPSASQLAAEDVPNPLYFLTSGKITIGRPAKKGGTTGKADILIFGEGSVSSVHCTLEVQPGQHGAVTITDSSKYGTHIRKGAPGAAEEKLMAGHQATLQAGDVLRFGTKCRYKLTVIPITLCCNSSSNSSSGSSDPQLVAAAAACNAILTEHCDPETCTHCLMADGQVLTAQALVALLEGLPLVTPVWLQTLASKVVWARAVLDPESSDTYKPQQVLLPANRTQQQQQQQVAQQQCIMLSSWQGPSPQLLKHFVLVLDAGCQADLKTAAALLGAEVHSVNSSSVSGIKQAEPAAARLAADMGGAAVRVLPAAAAAAAGSTPDQGVQAVVDEGQLLVAMATGDVTELEAAVAAGRAAAAAAEEQAKAAAAAAAAAAVAAGADSEAEETTEEGDEAADADVDPEDLQAVMPVLSRRQQQQQQQQQQQRQQAALGAWGDEKSAAAAAAVAPMAAAPAAAPVTLAGRKRTAPLVSAIELPAGSTGTPAAADGAAAAAAIDGSPMTRKRLKLSTSAASNDFMQANSRKEAVVAVTTTRRNAVPAAAAAGAAATAAAAASLHHQQQQQLSNGVVPQNVAAADHHVLNTSSQQAPPPQQQQQQHFDTVAEGVLAAPLITRHHPTPPTAAWDEQATSDAPVVNYKAFRRKQQGVAGQHPQQQQQGCTAGVTLAVADVEYKGLDAEAFLKEEQHRLDRLRKADELFNANIKAIRKKQ